MLSVYSPVKTILRVNGNIDNEERMTMLTTYKNCMVKSFKENAEGAAAMRNNLKDELLKGLVYSTECHRKSESSLDLVQSNAVYYLCGYLLHSRAPQINCQSCIDSLSSPENELPSDFYASYMTSLKTKGGLLFASLGMFHTFAKVERMVQDHFKGGDAYIRDSFELIIRKIAGKGLTLPNICCDSHRNEMVPFLIYEYIEIKYHLESKRLKVELVEKAKKEQHKLRKLSNMV